MFFPKFRGQWFVYRLILGAFFTPLIVLARKQGLEVAGIVPRKKFQ